MRRRRTGGGWRIALLLSSCSEASPLSAPSPERALAEFEHRDAIHVVLETSRGQVRCELDAARAPRAVALFTALAQGTTPFRDPHSGQVVRRPFYRQLPFFRAVADVYVQTGCPLGNGTGHPGFRIPVESSADDSARLSRPGALLMARYTPAPNRADPAPPAAGDVIGSQFAIALSDMSHLAGSATVIGACQDLGTVRSLAWDVSERRPAMLAEVHVVSPRAEGKQTGASRRSTPPPR